MNTKSTAKSSPRPALARATADAARLASPAAVPAHPGRLPSLAAALALCALALAACATVPRGPDVRVDRDPAADFATYRSFSFMRPLGTDEQGYTTLVSQRLMAATRSALESRGYVHVEDGGDLIVNFGAHLEDRTEVRRVPGPSIGFGYGFRRYGTWVGYQDQVDVRQYEEGTLTIDLVDARRRQLVWSGTVVGEVTERTRRDLAAAVESAVRAVFERYPYTAGAGA